jgi:hypothetical protein
LQKNRKADGRQGLSRLPPRQIRRWWRTASTDNSVKQRELDNCGRDASPDDARLPVTFPEQHANHRLVIPTTGVARFVCELECKRGVGYTPTPLDQWAQTVTRFGANEIYSGPVQDLLVALKRAGTLSADEMAALLVNCLREQKHGNVSQARGT